MRPPTNKAIAALIGAPCLIRKDRMGRALFISDYPRRSSDPEAAGLRLTEAGYALTPLDDLTLIDWAPAQYAAWYAAQPQPIFPAFDPAAPERWGLKRLLHQHPAPYAAQDAAVLRQALRYKLLDEQDKLQHLLTRAIADALREHRAPPWDALKLL